MTRQAQILESEEIDRYRRDGYLACGPVFDAEEVGELIRLVDTLVASLRWAVLELSTSADGSYSLLPMATRYDARYRELVLGNPALLDLVESVLGPAFRLLEDQVFYKPGPGAAVEPHQDNAYYGIERPRIVTCWVALDACTAENGCLRIAPGSHRGPVPHRKVGETYIRRAVWPDSAFVDVPADPGHVVLLDGLAVHGSGANTTDRPRRALNVVCMHPETVATLRVFNPRDNPYLRRPASVGAAHVARGLPSGLTGRQT